MTRRSVPDGGEFGYVEVTVAHATTKGSREREKESERRRGEEAIYLRPQREKERERRREGEAR